MGISYGTVLYRSIKGIESGENTCTVMWMLYYSNYIQFKFRDFLRAVIISSDTVPNLKPEGFETYQKELHSLLLKDELPVLEDLAKAKYYFRELFLCISKTGTIRFIYEKENLLTSKEMQQELGIGRTTLHRYVQSGMEIANGYIYEGYGHQRYPKENIFYKKNKEWDILSQNVIQKTIQRNQVFKDYVHSLQEQADKFEVKYRKPFNELFLNEEDIKNFKNKEDYQEWKKLINKINELT